MLVLEYGGSIILIDAGLMFPKTICWEWILLFQIFLTCASTANVSRRFIVTHGHEDHIGAIPFLVREFNVPTYATALTLALIREKLREHGLLERAHLHEVKPRYPFELSPFQVEFIQVCHSIPDGVGLAIRTPVARSSIPAISRWITPRLTADGWI